VVIKLRGGSFGSRLAPGDPVSLERPSTFFKEAYETLVWVADTPAGERAFYKMYRRRTLPSWWKGKALRYRAEREYDRLLVLAQAGVGCSEPLACLVGSGAEHGRYEIVVTREIPHARKLAEYLREQKKAGREPELGALFAAIRRMHAAGVYHGTLTPNNIVVSEPPGQAPAFHVVDLPRAVDFPYDLEGTRMAWYDLIHFVCRTSDFVGREPCLPVLDAYMVPTWSRDRFLKHLERYRPNKGLRIWLRNEFGFRSWLAQK